MQYQGVRVWGGPWLPLEMQLACLNNSVGCWELKLTNEGQIGTVSISLIRRIKKPLEWFFSLLFLGNLTHENRVRGGICQSS